MKQQSSETTACQSCGASVYPEHLNSGIARYENGKLLCAHCVAEFEQEHDATATGDMESFEPIRLEPDDMDSSDAPSAQSTEMSSSRIHALSESTLGHHAGAGDEDRFKRPLDPKSPFATRCRTFHGKLSDGAIEFLNMQINEWLDRQKDVSVKFVESNIGMFEGKHKEPNLIITLFY